jgi:hypothetical protein
MVKRYDFDGEQLSAGQISRKYPAWSESTWGLALSQGVRSLADMQERDRAGRKNRIQAARRPDRHEPTVARKTAPKRGTYRQDVCSMGLRS